MVVPGLAPLTPTRHARLRLTLKPTPRPMSKLRARQRAYRIETPGHTIAAMQALAILGVVGVVAVVLCGWLAGERRGSRSPGSGPLGLRSAREILESREQMDAEDLAQLLEACNARRRRRGEPERSVEEVELQVTREQHDAWRAV
jgi:hypothetical protein